MFFFDICWFRVQGGLEIPCVLTFVRKKNTGQIRGLHFDKDFSEFYVDSGAPINQSESRASGRGEGFGGEEEPGREA